MKTPAIFVTGLSLLIALVQNASAQVFANFENVAAESQSVFRQPSFAGSTGGFLDDTPNTAAVTATVPSGNPEAGAQALGVSWSFKTGTINPWLQLRTLGTADHPNPVIDVTQFLKFDLFTDRDLKVALGVREVTTTAAIGDNGGSTGAIEWTGLDPITPKNGSSPNPARTVPANIWTTLWFNVDGETAAAFTGTGANGVVSTANGLAVLEHLALVPADGLGAYSIYLDNIEVTPVPEPATSAVIFGLLALGAGLMRRRFQA